MLEPNYGILKIPARVRRFSKPLGFVASVLAVGFLGVTDCISGSELSFSIFYLIPISFATLFNGRTMGFLVSVLSAATWLAADLASGGHYSHVVIPYWNTAVRLGYFSLHTVLLSVLLGMIEQMRVLALRDPLTGASNWRFFEETGRREIERMRRSKKPMTLSYIDLDNFKLVNDSFGHGAGDDLLKMVVDTIQSNIRPTDLLARAGGDEFALLFPDTDVQGSRMILTRLREAFNTTITGKDYPVTMSIGSVTFTVLPSSLEAMLAKADGLMYAVKKEGKNNIKHEQWPPHVVA